MSLPEPHSALHHQHEVNPEYLTELVDFIIDHKDQLPGPMILVLRETFGKKASQRLGLLRNREDALKRVRSVKREDIKTPDHLSEVIPFYEERGDLFWAGGMSSPTKQIFGNVLTDLYFSNKRETAANSVRRAFYCAALYRVIQRILKLHDSKSFTTNIALFCAEKILQDSDTGKIYSKDDIVVELKSDYKAGSVYDSYAQRGGCGIFFYLFVLPSKLYEKFLNKGEDVDTVLSHYNSTGFQQEDSAKSAAASIMAVIISKFDSQVSIFKDYSVPRRVNMPARKRGYCADWESELLPIKARKSCHDASLRPAKKPHCGQKSPDNTTGRNVYSRYESDSGLSNNSGTHDDGRLSTYQSFQSQVTGSIVPAPCEKENFESSSLQRVQEQHVSPINTDSQSYNDQQTGYPLIYMQHNLSQSPFYLTESPKSTDAETFPYSIPSFNAISAIPSLPHSCFPTSQEESALPSTSLGHCIPSFSQITGIPSPD